MSYYTAYYDSPLGLLQLQASDTHVLRCDFVTNPVSKEAQPNALLNQVTDWLAAYFAQQFTPPTFPLAPQGTAFRQQVWQALQAIPVGVTRSYADIAHAIEHPKAVRAIGQANHHNPLSILIPCHRVIGHDGRLVGYGSGLWRKTWLLEHEGVVVKERYEKPSDLSEAESVVLN